ncbi:hypothetical protein [Novosphingobium sp. TCA1]|jgi:hypothetical protein|uniref:hypothetical protein n=1 Tax=Novosphingobium sp. TCA1 TaxID=2682474 RepID=UPI001308FC22|nr:hypothetical protein [Novosphingobium sp. TCA1]GFE72370.1 hypothetical protein NTCA1_00190 [Novosphingobium sp. TCA1]
MPALPYQEKLLVPIDWNIAPIKQTMQAGAYTMSGTVGWRPWTETATLTFAMSKEEARDFLARLKAGMFNAVYDYECSVRGPVRVRPTDSFGFGETYGSLHVTVTLNVEVVSG